MFTEAIARAGKFTIPVVISSRTVTGKCRCEIGAGVVVNPEGWVLTAAHVLALIRSQQEAVQAFHVRARQLGASDDGEPGLRPEYTADYYAAFIRDPDGNRIEAVCYLNQLKEG